MATLLRKILSTPWIAHLPVRVRSGIAQGARWTLFPWSAYWRGTHEPSIQARLQALTPDWTGRQIWDLGSHYGIYTVGFGLRVGPTGGVASFEPNPLSYARLVRHVRMNRLSWVKTFPCAVSNHRDTQQLYVDQGMETTSSHLAYERETWNKDTRTIPVDLIVLDDLVDTGEIQLPHFVKVDVEGHAHKALAGALRAIKSARPILMVGFHSDSERNGVLEILNPLGYRCTPLENAKDGLGDFLFEPNVV